MTEVYTGEDQLFQSGYSLKWHPVRVVPEGSETVSVDDPWLLRIERGNGKDDMFIEPDKAMDGPVLVLSKTFTPAQTAELAKDKEVMLVVEFGSEALIRPRMFHKLILQKEFRAERTHET